MGGTTFQYTHPDLKVPRMSPEVYNARVKWAIEKLHTLFLHVTSPPAAPGKKDHGDIDTIVAGWKTSSKDTSDHPDQTISELDCFNSAELRKQLQVLFQPTVLRWQLNSPILILLLPVDVEDKNTVFFQLDIEISLSQRFQWKVFRKSYGDFHAIIGTALRGVNLRWRDAGLTLKEQGISRAKARSTDPATMVVLTNDPKEMLDFLGLSYETYLAGWATEEKFFAYIAGMRFLKRAPFEFYDPEKREEVMGRGRVELHRSFKELEKRKAFKRFVVEYVPSIEIAENEWTKENVRDLAIRTFAHRMLNGEWVGTDEWHLWWRENQDGLWSAGEMKEGWMAEENEYRASLMEWLWGHGELNEEMGKYTEGFLRNKNRLEEIENGRKRVNGEEEAAGEVTLNGAGGYPLGANEVVVA